MLLAEGVALLLNQLVLLQFFLVELSLVQLLLQQHLSHLQFALYCSQPLLALAFPLQCGLQLPCRLCQLRLPLSLFFLGLIECLCECVYAFIELILFFGVVTVLFLGVGLVALFGVF